MKKILVKFCIPVAFFLVSFITLKDYGINWDEPFHFNRGQAYLRYFLTGKTNYLDIPAYPKLKGASDFMGREGEPDIYLNSKTSSIPPDPSFRRSYFQSDVYNFEYFIKNADIVIRAPAAATFRTQEYHTKIYHAVCAEVEERIFRR